MALLYVLCVCTSQHYACTVYTLHLNIQGVEIGPKCCNCTLELDPVAKLLCLLLH